MVEISEAEDSELTPEITGVRKTIGCPQIKGVVFSLPVSSHLALAFHQGHSPEAHTHGLCLPSSLESAVKPSLWTLKQPSASQHRPSR